MVRRPVLDNQHPTRGSALSVSAIGLALCLAALARVALLPLTHGHDFMVWDDASRLVLRGVNPYTHWRDMPNAYPYLPVFLYMLLPLQWLALHTALPFTVLGKLPIVAADLVVGATLYRWLLNAGRSQRLALVAACLYLFNPLVLYNGAFLGRFDAVALAFFLPALMARGSRFALLYGLAVATKTFPIFILPALLIGRYRRSARELAGGAAVILAVALPFLVWDPGALLYNLALREPNVVPVPLGLSWHYVLYALSPARYRYLVSVLLVLFAAAVVLWRNKPPLTLCALTFSAFLLVDHKVWDQYLTWPLPFLIALALLRRDLKAGLLAAGLTLAALFNNEQSAPVDHRFYFRLLPLPTVGLNVLVALGIVLYIALTWWQRRPLGDGAELLALRWRSVRSQSDWAALSRRLAHPAASGILVFVLILAGYLLSYNVDKPTHNADWYIRYQVTCSIVERNAFYINPYDGSQRSGPGADGHVYAQYTLGQSVAMIPLYLLGRVLAGVPNTNCDARIANTLVFLTCKALDLILGALLCALFFATARLLGYARRTALALTLLLAFGTSLWPDVLSNEEHTMESLFLLAAAYAALRYTLQRRKSRLWVLVMGLAAGLVFVTRVAGVIALPIFALYLVVAHRWARSGTPGTRTREESTWRPLVCDLALYAAGVLPSIAVNAAYDALRFGSPLRTGPYPDGSLGYPPWLGLPNLLISPGKGLLWYSPAVILLLLAARPFWRRHPLPARLCALICGGYLLFYANVNYWHGDPAWGPRYLYAALPYLVLPLGEVWRRWGRYRLPVRGLLVGVLAASFLVQLSTATVSYWRHWYLIYGYHHDQVEDYGWGSNMNYWWKPDQSPILFTLAGIADVTQQYVAHAPLLWHTADQRLSDPRESSIYPVYGQAAIYLTDVDKLRVVGNWNTFTSWWLHVYPWWDEETVVRLALALVAIVAASGGLLLAGQRSGKITARPNGQSVSHAEDGASGNGHRPAGGIPPVHVLAPERAHVPIAMPIAGSAPGYGGLAVATRPASEIALEPGRRALSAAGLRPLGLAALAGALLYGGIVAVAAARAPRSAPPLVHAVAAGAAVHDGNWTYRVVSVTSLRALPGGIAPPVDAAHHYVLVRVRLYNPLGRPQRTQQEWFDLTDPAGLRYPWMSALRKPLAELYHLMPAGSMVPAHSAQDSMLVFQVRNGPDMLELLGPGITLQPLHQ